MCRPWDPCEPPTPLRTATKAKLFHNMSRHSVSFTVWVFTLTGPTPSKQRQQTVLWPPSSGPQTHIKRRENPVHLRMPLTEQQKLMLIIPAHTSVSPLWGTGSISAAYRAPSFPRKALVQLQCVVSRAWLATSRNTFCCFYVQEWPQN